MLTQRMMALLVALSLMLLTGCANKASPMQIDVQKITAPEKLLSPCERPNIPQCVVDSCVAEFIVKQNQALADCADRMEVVREWSL